MLPLGAGWYRCGDLGSSGGLVLPVDGLGDIVIDTYPLRSCRRERRRADSEMAVRGTERGMAPGSDVSDGLYRLAGHPHIGVRTNTSAGLFLRAKDPPVSVRGRYTAAAGPKRSNAGRPAFQAGLA